jgi:hypothetical protein
MKQRTTRPREGDGRITVGGNVQGSALTTGRGNTLTIIGNSGAPALGDRAEVLRALSEIHTALKNLSGPHAKTAQREIKAAVQSVSENSSDKMTIGGALESALEATRKTSEFAEIAGKLLPLVRVATGWLGDEWSHLVSLLG